MEFEIKDGETAVGTLQSEESGLYTAFCARCRFDDGQMRRILLAGQGQTADLGICVPDMGGVFGICTKRATGRLPAQPWECYAVPAGEHKIPAKRIAFEDLPRAHLENGQIVAAPIEP